MINGTAEEFKSEDVKQGQLNDTLTGASTGVALLGGAGNDTMTSTKSATDVEDTLEGGAGADTLSGNYAGSPAGVVVDIATDEASGGDAEGDVISEFFRLTGSEHDDTLTASAATGIVIGGATADDVSIGETPDAVVITVAGAETFGTIVLSGAPDITIDDILFR